MKHLLLFGLVSGSCGICLGLGAALGFVIDGRLGSGLGAIFGGISGAMAGSEIGYRLGAFEVSEWDRLVWGGPQVGLGVGALVPALYYNGDAGVSIAIFGIVGSGVGALVAKYMLRFFIHDPPPSIR